jgi:predicted secreted protein
MLARPLFAAMRRLGRRTGKWVTVKTVTRKIGAGGAYSWTYKAARSGGYRVRATIRQTATHMAAKTTWRMFKLR